MCLTLAALVHRSHGAQYHVHTPCQTVSIAGLQEETWTKAYSVDFNSSEGVDSVEPLVSMWLFGFASTLMVVFFIAYCAILACWILVAAVRNGVEINQ